MSKSLFGISTSSKRVTFALLAASALVPGCNKTPPASSAPLPPLVAPADVLNEALAKLPGFVDKDMYKGFFNMASRCDVDVMKSSVECKDDYLKNIVTICQRGVMPRDVVLQTASYVFATGTDKQKTAAAELLYLAYPTGKGALPNKKVIQKLIAQLGSLPEEQAIDAVPVIADVAGEGALEQELMPVLDTPGRDRVAAAGYRRLMGGARMRIFEKLWDLTQSKNVDLAVAAIEAPRAMGGRSVDENDQICTWMASMTKDGRPVVENRAAGFLAGCGSKYLETLLTLDEQRKQSGKMLMAGLDAYANVCNTDVKNPYGNASKIQCARLKQLATNVLSDASSSENERVRALDLLSDQFPGKDTLALATKFADGTDSRLSRKAGDSVRELGNAEPQQKPAVKN